MINHRIWISTVKKNNSNQQTVWLTWNILKPWAVIVIDDKGNALKIYAPSHSLVIPDWSLHLTPIFIIGDLPKSWNKNLFETTYQIIGIQNDYLYRSIQCNIYIYIYTIYILYYIYIYIIILYIIYIYMYTHCIYVHHISILDAKSSPLPMVTSTVSPSQRPVPSRVDLNLPRPQPFLGKFGWSTSLRIRFVVAFFLWFYVPFLALCFPSRAFFLFLLVSSFFFCFPCCCCCCCCCCCRFLVLHSGIVP